MWCRSRFPCLAAVALLVALAASSTSSGDPTDAPAATLQPIPGPGPFLGWTHGGDPIPDPESEPVVDARQTGPLDTEDTGFARAPHCVPRTTPASVEPRSLVIYAHAHDDTDRYASKAPVIRNLVHNANALVHDAGLATGTAANIKVACEGGEVIVEHVVLPTDRANASPNSIMRDLNRVGYDDPAEKYWVYYDDRGACGCGGIANFNNDATPTPFNLNNGWGFPMYAITFGYDSTRIMLHELGHTIGAVVTAAPHTTGSGHCTDGRDIMCYPDGGPYAHQYTNGACGTMVWDCNRDDYFHTNPETGSYLDLNWNLGSRVNRFFVFADQVVDTPVLDVHAPSP